MIQKNNLNIELYLLCFNEEKMIRHTLNYYSKICNKIIVIDNQSTDKSIELACAYPNLEFRILDTEHEFIEDKLTEVKNNCWKGSNADYVIVCDMDEFLYDENLIEKLTIAKQQNICIPKIKGYNMINDFFPEDYKKLLTNQVKYGVRTSRFDKNIIFNPKMIKEINYRPGAHLCNPVVKKDSNCNSSIELQLLHYKYLGKEYLYQKHEKYAKRMSNISREKKHGAEYLDGKAHIDTVFKLSDKLNKIIK